MVRQKNNRSTRCEIGIDPDSQYLSKYYREHGRFPLFQQVLIETRTDCNKRCAFCPQAHNHKTFGKMTWSCYKTIIGQLLGIGYNGRVALMVSNEPLLEDRLGKMIRFAKNASPRLFLDITTNGKLLTLEKVDKLFRIGVDNINVNDYRSDRDRFPQRLSPNLERIRSAYFNNPKLTFQFRRTDEHLPNYGGNIEQPFSSADHAFCNFPFRKVVVSYKGDVLLCCNDFLYATSFGNIMTRRIDLCWNDPALNGIRFALLKGTRMSLCAKCNDSQDYNVFG